MSFSLTSKEINKYIEGEGVAILLENKKSAKEFNISADQFCQLVKLYEEIKGK
jgi:hypothetical protein